MTKAQPAREPKRVKLSYDFTHKTLITSPRTPVLKKGDRVTFTSPQGEVHVLLRPADAFSPAEFKKGDPPVKVVKNVEGTIWCGGKYRDGEGITATEINIVPRENGDWGAHTVDH